MVSLASVADPKIFKGGGIKFISLAHNQLDAVYTGKADLLKKIGANRGGGAPTVPRNPMLTGIPSWGRVSVYFSSTFIVSVDIT